MSDQGKQPPMQQWELHFHRTMRIAGGTEEADVFTLKLTRDNKLPFLTFTVPHSKEGMELVHFVCARMNMDDQVVVLDPGKIEELNAAFHGPWHHKDAVGHYLMLTDAEVLKIKRFIYRENAARISIEGQYRFLFADHHKLMKAYAVVEQELLRLHQKYEASPRPIGHDDLLTPDTDEAQLEIPDMVCRKPALTCNIDPVKPNKRIDVV